jgi:hypothetical protein
MAKQGGKRKGAGRNPAPSFRIRVEWEKEIKETVKAKIIALTENCN